MNHPISYIMGVIFAVALGGVMIWLSLTTQLPGETQTIDRWMLMVGIVSIGLGIGQLVLCIMRVKDGTLTFEQLWRPQPQTSFDDISYRAIAGRIFLFLLLLAVVLLLKLWRSGYFELAN